MKGRTTLLVERWERPSSSPNCGTMQQRFTTARTHHSLIWPLFPPLRDSPLPQYVAVSHLAELLPCFLISHFCLIFIGFCSAFCLLFASSYTFFFHFPLYPPHHPPSCPKEIWFPPLPALFTILPVWMADKGHITLSIWRHLSKLLYAQTFTHLCTLNAMKTTSILLSACVLGINIFFKADIDC